MKQHYTKPELLSTVEILKENFDTVSLIDEASGRRISLESWQPEGECVIGNISLLHEGQHFRSRRWKGRKYQTSLRPVDVEGMECLLALQVDLTDRMAGEDQESRDLRDLIEQTDRSLYWDPVIGCYNRRYLEELYAPAALGWFHNGIPVGIAMVTVNQYSELEAAYGEEAVERLLGTAASELQKLIDLEKQDGIVVRYSKQQLCVTCIGHSHEHFVDCLRQLVEKPLTSQIKLGKKVSFDLHLGVAGYQDTDHWNSVVALAEQRLAACSGTGSQIVAE